MKKKGKSKMYKIEIIIKVPNNATNFEILGNLLSIMLNFLKGLYMEAEGVVYLDEEKN